MRAFPCLSAGVVSLMLLVVLAGCQTGININNPPNTPDLPDLPDLPDRVEDTTGKVVVRVTDQTGAAVPGVSATLGTASAQGDDDGVVLFETISPGQGLLVTLRAAGFIDGAARADVISGQQVTLNTTMAATGTPQQVTGGTAAAVTHQGATVNFPDDALAAGTTATATVTFVKPGDTGFGSIFPGVFQGLRTDGTTTTEFESFGFVDVTLRDGQGNDVSLATGAQAEIVVPIDPANDPGDATVPMWYYNASTGRWVEEGVFTRDEANGVYRGPASHFTPWNCDKPYQPAYVDVTVTDKGGNPIPGSTVTADSGGASDTAYTDSDGTTGDASVPPNDQVDVTVDKDGIESPGTTVVTPGAGETVTTTVELDVSYVHATVINDNGTPVRGARVLIQGTGWRADLVTGRIGDARGIVPPNSVVQISARKLTVTSGVLETQTQGPGETLEVVITLGEGLVVPTLPIPFPPGLAGLWKLTHIGPSQSLMVPVPLDMTLTITESGQATVQGDYLQDTYQGQILITSATEEEDGTRYTMRPYLTGSDAVYVTFLLSSDGNTLYEFVQDGTTSAVLIAAKFSRLSSASS